MLNHKDADCQYEPLVSKELIQSVRVLPKGAGKEVWERVGPASGICFPLTYRLYSNHQSFHVFLVFNVCIMMLCQRGMKTDAFICMSSLIYQGLLNKHGSKTGGLGQVTRYQFLPFVISAANICPQKKTTSQQMQNTQITSSPGKR